MKITLNSMKSRSNPYSRGKRGKRQDLNNTYFRSSWEANIARFYNFAGVKWQYEPREFVFDKIKRGPCISYTPDFYLPEEDKWVEVKGWMDDRSKTKLARFQRYYPQEYLKLQVIGSKEYRAIEKDCKNLVPGWECSK